MTKTLFCGEAIIDFLPIGDTGGFRPVMGGAPFNAAVAFARLGKKAALLSRLSTDPFGERQYDHLLKAGADTAFVQRGGEPSALALVHNADTSPEYRFYLAGTADRAWDAAAVPAALPDDIAAIHTGSYPFFLAPTAEILGGLLAREGDRRFVSFDPNVRPALTPDRGAVVARLDAALPKIDVIKASIEDIAWLYPGEDPAAVAEHWRRGGAGLVVVTQGANGAMAVGSSGSVHVPARPVDVTDTVGAGDSFLAGFLCALDEWGGLSGDRLGALTLHELETALTFAADVAALTCTKTGADSPTRAALPARPPHP